ncbi:hypothetical protein LBMAG56_47000 [Verrucomicrobiota bacterium]|nr:hypothetical protein LBMAG56_47000 [Verrucomicrobiota bacterium]
MDDPPPLPLEQALDTTGRTWTTGGDGNWAGQVAVTTDGVDAAQSGAITRNQTNWMETTVTGPGTLSFWWKVSSESGHDFLGFSSNGVEQSGKISGEVDWTQKSYELTASGPVIVRWSYSKDGGNSSGADAGWVDQVAFVPAPPASAPLATTGAASGVAGTAAAVAGTVSANWADATVSFEYGATTSYGSAVAVMPATVAGSLPTAVSATLVGLQPLTPYHYRVKAVNNIGTTYGSDGTFTTRATLAGDLDLSFGTGGKVTTPIGSGDDLGKSVAVQSDGKIIVAGFSSNGGNDDFALVRYTAAGALDPSFGTGGKVTTDFGSGTDQGYSVAVQSDGKIIVAGYTYNGSDYNLALVRYTTAGALDPSFGTGGKVTTPIGSSTDVGDSVAVQSDGKILVAGYSYNGSSIDFALVRYTAAGALDPSFGTGGKVTTDFGGGHDYGYSVAVQSDGKILVAGFSGNFDSYNFALVRYTAAGALDPSFGTGGKVTTDFGSSTDYGVSVAVQGDGKIIVTGYFSNGSNDDLALARYTTAGALDPGFGTGGKVITAFGSGTDQGYSVAVQGDGKIIVAGYTANGSNTDFALVRYTAAGALDPSFGTGGKVTTDFGSGNDYGRSVAVQSDGKIIVAGEAWNGSNTDFALVRYEGVAAPVLTAQPQSQTVPAGTNVTFTASATGTSPSYFWRKDGAFLPTATNLSLTVSNVTRAASGDYSVILTNASGSVTSAPALLRVLVPQRVEGGTNLHRLPDGRFQLHFRDPDGTLASDLTRLEIHSTTNFTGAGTVWVTNTTGLSIINGLIRFEDASSTNLLRRFYRVIEK